MSDKIKTLSQAIRLGATFRPQCFGTYMHMAGKSCAIGAALEVITGRFTPNEATKTGALLALAERFPYAHSIGSKHLCPVCHMGYIRFTLRQLCEHLNECHEWTREAIADHVAQIEKTLDL